MLLTECLSFKGRCFQTQGHLHIFSLSDGHLVISLFTWPRSPDDIGGAINT